jgi:fucose permease
MWGLFLFTFAPSTALLRDELHLSRTVEGFYGTALAVGGMTGGFLAPRIVARVGRGTLMRAGSIMAMLGLLIFISVHVYVLTLVGLVVACFGAAVSMVGINAFITEQQGLAAPRSLAEANGFASGLGLVGPLVVGGCVAIGWGWRPAVVVTIAGYGVVELLRGRTTSRYDARHGHSHTKPGHEPSGRLPTLYWFAFAVIVMITGTEFCMTLWGSDLLRDRAGMGQAAAAASLASIVGGMTFGRLAGAPFLSRYDPERALIGAFILAGIGFAVAWFSTSPITMIAGYVVAGMGIGLHWPLGVGRAIRASAGRTDRGAGFTLIASSMASGLMPLILGAASDRVGVHTAFLIVPVLICTAVILIVLKPVPAVVAEDPES